VIRRDSAIEILMSRLQTPSHEVTQLLLEWSNGDQQALEKLLPLVYRELRKLAHQHLNRERPGHTLQTTDLVHEAYLKLVNQKGAQWQNRAQFFGIAAQLMRRILVDRARHNKRAKRGGGVAAVSIDQETLVAPKSQVDLVALDEALKTLAKADQRKARIVELRFFGGLSVEETADFLKVSPITVMRDWKMAKAWLHKALS
jgi:RNA polymerase sigma-70 factor, ECF subfamily